MNTRAFRGKSRQLSAAVGLAVVMGTSLRGGESAPAFSVTGHQLPVENAAVEDALRATERERLRALVEEDLATAEPLHADDFQLITPFGQTLSKEEYLGAIASGAIDYLVFEPTSEITVRLYGDAAVIRYQSKIEIMVDGERLSARGWHTDLYERDGDHWDAVWSQMTAISME